MTFDANEILKRLENGEDVNDIAAAAANAINDAMKLQEKKKKEAEAQKKNETKRAKIEDLGFLIEEVIDFFNEYYPELLEGKEVSDAKVREIAGELVDIFDKAYDETLKFMNSDAFGKLVKNGDDDAIGNFLRENGLI